VAFDHLPHNRDVGMHSILVGLVSIMSVSEDLLYPMLSGNIPNQYLEVFPTQWVPFVNIWFARWENSGLLTCVSVIYIHQ